MYGRLRRGGCTWSGIASGTWLLCVNIDGSRDAGERAALVRKGGHAVDRVEQLELLVPGSAPLSSLSMIRVRTGLAGSASSAGRTGTVQATSWLVCSLDRLTPTRWQQARGGRPPRIDG